jgi:hypothetical protein
MTSVSDIDLMALVLRYACVSHVVTIADCALLMTFIFNGMVLRPICSP